jgi:CMP-N,N'-diacetyllegionaminic acid synthase
VPKILAIIPARGGSKGIPKKNIRPVAGKPLLYYTCEAALHSGKLDRIILSTENQEIAEIGQNCGVEVPFMRPPELAEDNTPGILPILHTVKVLSDKYNYKPDYILELQPTSPLRTPEDINNAVKIITEKKGDAVVAVSSAAEHPYLMKTIDNTGRLSQFIKTDKAESRRQDLPCVYWLNGALCMARREVLLEHQTWYTKNTYAYVMPRERSLNIDTEWDLALADFLLQNGIFQNRNIKGSI